MSCAMTRCADPSCGPCTVNERFRIVRCTGTVAIPKGEVQCRYVAGHSGACTADTRDGKVERAELKESAPLPDLSGPRAAAIALGQRKRHREGPVRQQR